MNFLRHLGFKLALVTSAATQRIAEFVQQELGLDYALATDSDVDATGCFSIDTSSLSAGLRKVDLLRLISRREDISDQNVILISTFPQPTEFAETCGNCIWFDSEEISDLRMTLYLLGFTAENLRELDMAPNSAPATPENDSVIFKIMGKDRPGLMAQLFSAVNSSQASVTELFQCNMKNILCLGMRLVLPLSKIEDCVKEILFTAHKLDLSVASEQSAMRSRYSPTARKVVITLTKFPAIGAADVAAVLVILSQLNINILDFRKLSQTDLIALEISASLPEQVDMAELRRRLLDVRAVDIGVQLDSVNRAARRVIVFDMDSTLIQQEVIDELGREAGVESEISTITEKAMRGEMDFFQSLQARVSFLKDQDAQGIFAAVKKRITLTPGAAELCQKLKNLGFKTAVISGGFLPIARYVQEILGLDYAFANELEVEYGLLTGRTIGPVVTPQRKRTLMKLIAQVEGCSLDAVIAVGDGANDILMLQAAGLGIAFCAKPKVQMAANFRINVPDLMAVTFLLGL